MPKSLFGVPVICPLTRLLPSWTLQTIVLFTTYSRILLGKFSSDIALKLLQLVSSSFLCSGVRLAVFQLVNTILFLRQSRNRQSIDRLSCRPLALKALEVCCPGILLFFLLSTTKDSEPAGICESQSILLVPCLRNMPHVHNL